MSIRNAFKQFRLIPRDDDFLDRKVGSIGEIYFDRNNNTLRLYDSDVAGGVALARADLNNISSSGLLNSLIVANAAVVKYTVTVNNIGEGNKYILNGEYRPSLDFVIGYTYVFNQDDPTNVYYPNPTGGDNNQHPLNFSADDPNGEAGSGTVYTEGVVYKLDGVEVDKAGYWAGFESASTREVRITVTNNTPTLLYYWCQNHLNMGNTINVNNPGTGSGGASVTVSNTLPTEAESGNLWLDTDSGRLFVYINDGDSEQWIQPAYPTFSGNYDDLTNKPTIPTVPTNISAFNNDTGYLTAVPSTINATIEADDDTVLVNATTATINTHSLDQVTATNGQALVWSNSNSRWEPGDVAADIGGFSLTGTNIDTLDSSAITVTPAITMQSDLTVENELFVSNAEVGDLVLTGELTSQGSGTPEIISDNEINLTAGTRVDLTTGPIRMARFTTAERDALTPQNGDIIYNTTANKFQGYENGAWANLI